MATIARVLAGSAVTLLLTVGPVLAQAPAAGKVSRLEGSAAVARTSAPQALALKTSDPVYLRDLVTTAEQSRAQLLLGPDPTKAKALVTIREKSALRITEVPDGSSIVEMSDGKLKVHAIKDRLRPGDRIEVRTPTAVTAVRGTTWVVEVSITPTGPITRVTVLDGLVDTTPLDPATGRPRGATVTLSKLQQIDVDGATPLGTPLVISQTDADHLDATFAFSLKATAGTSPDVVQRQLNQAASDAAAAQAPGSLPGTGGTGPSVSGDDLRSRSGVFQPPAPPSPPPSCSRC